MSSTIITQGSDALTTQTGDTLVTNDNVTLGASRVLGFGNVQQTSPVVIIGKDTWYYIQYWKNGVRQKPPTGGGVVGGYGLNITVWSPSSFYIITQSGAYLNTQADERIITQPYNPQGAGFVSGWGVLGVVWDESTVLGAGWVRDVHETLTPYYANWIITSHIGAFNFTPDHTGEVVKLVLPWYNWVYALRKLGNSGVVAYGENGVILLTPRGTAWGTRNLCQVGIKGKLAVCTSQDDLEHYFIDEQGFFWHISEGNPPKRIDFTHYFNQMNDNTVMTWDYKHDIIYICDGVHGYVWTKGGLGQGPATISGLGIRWGEDLFVVGPSLVTPDPFEICTDIIDFGSRFEKTINGIDLGVTLPVVNSYLMNQSGGYIYDQDGNPMYSQASQSEIYVAIDYRWDNHRDFITSPWVKVTEQGQAFFMVSGIEFKFRVKMLNYADIQLDYASIRVLYEDAKPLGMGDK